MKSQEMETSIDIFKINGKITVTITVIHERRMRWLQCDTVNSGRRSVPIFSRRNLIRQRKLCIIISKMNIRRSVWVPYIVIWNLLVEQGQALRLDCGDGVDHFDGDTRPHYHFSCQKCGCVMDLEMDPIDHIDQIAGAGFDGEIQGHQVLFYGLCPKCKA